MKQRPAIQMHEAEHAALLVASGYGLSLKVLSKFILSIFFDQRAIRIDRDYQVIG